MLAGSAAYAVAESMKWPIGHAKSLLEAKGFYFIITVATLIGVSDRLHVDRPDQGAAVVGGHQRRDLGAHHGGDDAHGGAARDHGHAAPSGRGCKRLGWFATVLMADAVVAMFVSMLI